MYCPKCGKENDDGAQFCGNCGNKLGVSPEAKQAPSVSTTATGAVTVGDGSTAATAHKTGRIAAITAAVVVAVVAIAVICVANIFGSANEATEGPSNSDSQHEAASVDDAAQSSSGDTGSQNGNSSGVSLEAYSWAELSKISSEIAEASDEDGAIEVAKRYNLCTPDGKLDGTQEKSVTLSDGTKTYVQIVGFAHDDKTDGGKAGITFIFKDAIVEHEMDSDDTYDGGWERSEMRSWLSSSVLGTLPEELRNKIVAVDKLTNNVGETADISSVTTTSDRLWLYSATELCGTIDYSDSLFKDIMNAEGSEYKLFRDSNVYNSGPNAILTKTFEGESCHWWERSPYSNNSCFFCVVNTDGGPQYSTYADEALGVVPGFCI